MASKASSLTKRQAVLLDRLVTFCERCGSSGLPFQVLKVIGYGSFFRRKERPGDVDLFVITGENHALYERFEEMVKGGLVRRGKRLAPADRMRLIASSHPDSAVSEAAGMFSEWLDGFSDAMLYDHKSIVDRLFAYHPQRFATRMLHAGLPGIRARLDRDYPRPASEVIHEIWSPQSPNVTKSVERIWSGDQREDLIAELRSFEEQSRPHLIQIAILNRISDRLARSRIRIVDRGESHLHDRYNDWLRSHDFGFDAKLCVEATDRLLDRPSCEGHPDPPGFETIDGEALGSDELANLVEEKRQGLKLLYDRAYVLRISTNYLALWCFLDKGKSKLGKRRYVMTSVTEGIPQNAVKPRLVRAILESELDRLGMD
jgi:hypothetical protein